MEQTEEWTVQRGRYITLETLAPVCDDLTVSLPAAQTDRPARPAKEREAHNEYTTSWDVIEGCGQNTLELRAKTAGALSTALAWAETGAEVEIMTRDRNFAPEVIGMSLTPSMRELQKRDVTFTVTWKLDAVRREGNALRATIGTDYGGMRRERQVDQVVINHGTRPLDDVYFDLRAGSSNLGEVGYEALVEGRPQEVRGNLEGTYQLFRIGDAVAARNTHAAICDALLLVKVL